MSSEKLVEKVGHINSMVRKFLDDPKAKELSGMVTMQTKMNETDEKLKLALQDLGQLDKYAKGIEEEYDSLRQYCTALEESRAKCPTCTPFPEEKMVPE